MRADRRVDARAGRVRVLGRDAREAAVVADAITAVAAGSGARAEGLRVSLGEDAAAAAAMCEGGGL